MELTLSKGSIGGVIEAMASKSQAHRLLICAALSDRPTEILCKDISADMEATAGCLQALGAGITYAHGAFSVTPIKKPMENPLLDCGESGSTLRFLLPVAGALGVNATFRLHGRLASRPLSPLWEEMEAHGCSLSRPTPDTLRCQGKMTGGEFQMAGNVSSQFLSGLFFALPLLEGTSDIMLTTEAESQAYLSLTLRALEQFGVKLLTTEKGWRCERGSYLSPGYARVEGDWSNAAFWLCAGAVSRPITVKGLNPHSQQGDRAVLELLSRFGAQIHWSQGGVTVSPRPLHGIKIDARNIPDLVPPLALAAACAQGTTRIYGAERLRIKESDRLQSVAGAINALGGKAEITEDGLLITGADLTGGRVDSQNDHRIAMLAGISSALCPVTICGAEAVNKSYPRFWEDLQAMTDTREAAL